MKTKYVILLFLLTSIILFGVVGCQSTPPEAPPVEDTTPPPPDPDLAAPDQASLNNLNAAAARAEAARKMVQDFNGPANFADDWNDSEALYNQAQSGRRIATVRDVRESLARYNSAADSFEALAEKAIPRYAEELQKEVIAARNGALNAGAGYLAQDYLQGTDETASEALALYEAEDYYAAQAMGILARDAYKVLGDGVEAYKVRLEIESRGFVRYDSAAIGAADEIGLSALSDYEAREIASAGNKVLDVRARYTQSLDKGKESYSADCAATANAERQRALDLKANVAVRLDYETANGVLTQANATANRRDFDQSAGLYNQSRTMFEAVTAAAREKRRIAEEALRAAELKMVESDEAAQRAELILEGGSR